MARSPIRRLGDFAASVDATIEVHDDRTYRLGGVYSFGRGMIDRGALRGDETRYRVLHRVAAGQMVFSKLGAWEGGIAVVPDEFDQFFLSPEFPVLAVDKSQCDLAYVRHLAGWRGLWDQMAPRGSMIRRKRTTPATFLDAQVPLPPIAEQGRIASTLDRAMEALTRMEKRRGLESATQASLLRTLFTPDGPNVYLGDVLTLNRRPVVVDLAKTYREIGVRSFGMGVFHKDPVAGSSLGDKRVFEIHPGELVLSNVFAWEGAVAVTSDAEAGMVASHRFMTYGVDAEIADIRYLRAYLLGPVGASLINAASPGSAGRNRTLGIEAFAAQRIQLPPVAEQRRIADIYDRFMASVAASDRARLLGSALRKSALNAAFSGEL